jgi:hypothetical protein
MYILCSPWQSSKRPQQRALATCVGLLHSRPRILPDGICLLSSKLIYARHSTKRYSNVILSTNNDLDQMAFFIKMRTLFFLFFCHLENQKTSKHVLTPRHRRAVDGPSPRHRRAIAANVRRTTIQRRASSTSWFQCEEVVLEVGRPG